MPQELPLIVGGRAEGSLPNRRTASSRKCTSGGTSDGRRVVTERAGHRPRLRTFGNRCPRVVSVLQSRTAAAFKTCGRTWSSARTAVDPASTIGHCRALAGLSVTFSPWDRITDEALFSPERERTRSFCWVYGLLKQARVLQR